MQETNHNKKLVLENQSLKKELEETKKELAAKNDKVEVMGASLTKMAQISHEMLNSWLVSQSVHIVP
jgi:regulator of replication initiation timing